MKGLILFFGLALAVPCAGQIKKQRYQWNRAITPITLSFFAGASWGTHEVLQHRYRDFERVFPNANDQFWNPAISWQNKYTNDVPVWFTDGKHLLASCTQASLFGAGMCVTIGERRPVRHYLIDVALSFGAYSLGNWVAYDLVFHR